MSGSVDLSKIQLPPEDANKPAELDMSEAGDGDTLANSGDDANKPLPPDDQDGAKTKLGAVEGEDRDLPENTPAADVAKKEAADKKAADDKAAADKAEADKKAAADAGKTDEEKKIEADAAAAKEKEDQDKKDAAAKDPEKTEVQKIQEEKRQLELDKANLEGKLEAMEKAGTISTEQKKEIKSAAQIAEEKVLEKRKGGWEPKDALELNRVYSEEFEKALDAKKADEAEQLKTESKALADRRIEIQKQVDSVYSEFRITEQAEQDKVANLAMKWANDGTANWSINTLKLAADHLKAKGEILKPAATTEPKPVVTEDKKTDTKTDVNNKISRPTNEGGTTQTPPKKSIGDLRRMSLDDIVLKSVGALG